MAGPVDGHELAKQMKKAFSRLQNIDNKIQDLQSRMSGMEQGMQRAIGKIMPKLDTLLEQHNTRDGAFSTSRKRSSPSDAGDDASTPATLLEAAERGDAEGVLRLLAGGADLQVRDGRGNSALHIAANGGNLATVSVLLGFGASVEALGYRHCTPLHCAAAQGHLKIVQSLLRAGASLEAEDLVGATPLVLATVAGHSEAVEALLQAGAKSDGGASGANKKPVFLAASAGHPKVVVLLLPREGSTDVCNEKGETLLVHAAKAEQWDVVRMLLRKGASAGKYLEVDESALALAAKAGRADVVKELLECGAGSDDCVVHSACIVAKTSAVVAAMVKAIPSIIHKNAGQYGLLYAAQYGRREVMVTFLEKGVDVNIGDVFGTSALGLSAANGHVPCIKELLLRGALVDKVGKDQETPLHMASRHGRVESVRTLLNAGASTTKVNSEGKTPLDVANSREILTLLTQARGFQASYGTRHWEQ